MPRSGLRGLRRLGATRRGLLVVVLVLGACGGEPEHPVLHVHAASSLSESFRDLADAFQSTHPGVEVALTFAGSQILRLQIEQGAAADVFASANPLHVEALVDAGLVSGERVFATNGLVVVVPRSNPAGLVSFSDLPSAKRLVVGTEHVPVGAYARQMLHNAGRRFGAAFTDSVLGNVASGETNVRLVRAKVELGEADAAIVYESDARGSDHLTPIAIPADLNVVATYHMGVVTGARNPDLAADWMGFVLSPQGQLLLGHRGFGPVESSAVDAGGPS